MATVFTNIGKAFASNKFANGNNTATANFIGWGTGAGTSDPTQTTLFAEDSAGSPAYARVAGTQTQQQTSVANDTYQVVGTITSNGSKTITNAGVFDAATSGNMVLKADFTGIPVLANDSIAFTFKLQFS